MYQTNSNGYVAFKAQTALGAPASGAGATILRQTGGAMRQTIQPVGSNEVRRDGMTTRGAQGSRRTAGQFNGELSLDLLNQIAPAVMRAADWSAVVTIDEAAMGGATVSVDANSITASAGSWIAAGLRVGDVIKLTSGFAAGNANRNLRITGLTATVITVAETLTVEAGPIAAYTVVKAKSLINPAAGSLVRTYVTVEEYEADIDASEVFEDCRFGRLVFAMQPNGLITVQTALMGTGKMTTYEAGEAPIFTDPTEGTALPMSAVDAVLRVGANDVLDLTAFNLTVDIGLSGVDVAASKFSPDVFDAPMTISGDFTVLREDLSYVAAALAETPLSLHLLAVENESEPKDFFSLFLSNFTITLPEKSELTRQGGPRTQRILINPELVGVDTRGGAYDPTMIKFATSAA